MRVFLGHPMFWTGLLVLWAQGVTEANSQDLCQESFFPNEVNIQRSKEDLGCVDTELNENFTCHLYFTNLLNCSWSYHTLQKGTQLSVRISICDDEETTIRSLNYSSEERVGSRSLILQEDESKILHQIIFQFNMSLHDQWTAYTLTYDMDMIEVSPPPQNLSATMKDGNLLVTWGVPRSRAESPPSCFEYELDLGDEGKLQHLSKQLSHTVVNADPAKTYRVRIRTRKREVCLGSEEWSEWSPTVTVEPVASRLRTLLIIMFLLGIPMVILAALQHQRVSKLLFPRIPRPPPKYIYFLEKNDTFSVFHPTTTTAPEEEITQVEEAE